MTAIHRINPEIWVMTPLGEALAIFMIDYGPSHNTVWVVSLVTDGSVTHIDSSEIKLMGNEMYDVPNPEKFKRRIK